MWHSKAIGQIHPLTQWRQYSLNFLSYTWVEETWSTVSYIELKYMNMPRKKNDFQWPIERRVHLPPTEKSKIICHPHFWKSRAWQVKNSKEMESILRSSMCSCSCFRWSFPVKGISSIPSLAHSWQCLISSSVKKLVFDVFLMVPPSCALGFSFNVEPFVGPKGAGLLAFERSLRATLPWLLVLTVFDKSVFAPSTPFPKLQKIQSNLSHIEG